MRQALWFVDSNPSIYEVREKQHSRLLDEDVEIVPWKGGFRHRLNFEHRFPHLWSTRATPAFVEEVSRRLGGATGPIGVDHLPFFVHTGPCGDEEIGETRVWLPDSRELATWSIWSNARETGTVIGLQDVPPGSHIVDTDARQLIEYVYGPVCVDRDSDTFLGDWLAGSKYHAEKARVILTKSPRKYEGDPGAALRTYLKDARISDMESYVRVALEFFADTSEALDFVCGMWNISNEHPEFKEILQGMVAKL